MALNARMVTIDCADPVKLASFWTAALDYTIARDMGPGWYIMLAPPEERRGAINIGLQRVPEARAGKNRVHIDFVGAGTLPELVDRLVALGATVLDRQEVPGLVWQVLADPEGNEFCILTPRDQ